MGRGRLLVYLRTSFLTPEDWTEVRNCGSSFNMEMRDIFDDAHGPGI